MSCPGEEVYPTAEGVDVASDVLDEHATSASADGYDSDADPVASVDARADGQTSELEGESVPQHQPVEGETDETIPPPANAFATNATATPNYLDATQNSINISRSQGDEAGVESNHDFGYAPIDHNGYIDPLDSTGAGADEISEIELLRQDNEVLKSVIRRSKEASTLNTQVHANIKLQSAYEGKCRELKKEVQLRKQSESLLAEARSKHQYLYNAKSTECKKYFDLTLSLRSELDILKEKSREQEALIVILRKENARLNTICKDNHINTHSSENSPTKPSVIVTKSLLTMSPTNFRKEVLKVNATTSLLNAASASTTKRRSVSPANPEALQGNNSMSNRSISPGSMSHSGTMPPSAPIPHPFLEIGQKVTWKGMQGVVRYIGDVEPLGADTWVGLELQEGRGEHSGLAFGKRYFTASARSSVFVRPQELGAGRKAGFESSNLSTSRSRSPQQSSPLTPARANDSTTSKNTSPKFRSSTAGSRSLAPATVAAKKRVAGVKRVAPQPADKEHRASEGSNTNSEAISIPTCSPRSPPTPNASFADAADGADYGDAEPSPEHGLEENSAARLDTLSEEY